MDILYNFPIFQFEYLSSSCISEVENIFIHTVCLSLYMYVCMCLWKICVRIFTQNNLVQSKTTGALSNDQTHSTSKTSFLNIAS